jgi:geranylgeranyl pyrophosphate synthase
MSNIEEQNLTEFLLEVKAKMANITLSENEAINEITSYVLSNTGKFIRSKIIFLYGSEIGVKKPKLIELASAAELIHLSTLVHDDIIDEADIRRNKPTVVNKWGIKKAILYGDFLYTKTFQALNSLENIAISNELIKCAENLIDGEFNQITIRNNNIVCIEQYYDVIEKKTAVLFSGILKCIGIEKKLDNNDLELLKQLGLSFGRAFQINDDLSDFNTSEITGKAEFKDLSEGKLTLPVIFLFEDSNSKQQDQIFSLIQSGEYETIKKKIIDSNCFKRARIEREKAISNCIEYTERFIKLDKLDNLRVFLKETLVA